MHHSLVVLVSDNKLEKRSTYFFYQPPFSICEVCIFHSTGKCEWQISSYRLALCLCRQGHVLLDTTQSEILLRLEDWGRVREMIQRLRKVKTWVQFPAPTLDSSQQFTALVLGPRTVNLGDLTLLVYGTHICILRHICVHINEDEKQNKDKNSNDII